MSELLGITGAIGSGKTTFAECLARTTQSHAHYETWYVIAELATAFNKALKAELVYETTQDDVELANQVLIWLPDAITESLHRDVVWSQLAITKRDTLANPELYKKLFAYLAIAQSKRALLDMPLTDETKEQFRPLLQWLGGYFVAKISKTIWYDEILRRIDLRDPTTSLVTIGGIRYPADAEAVRARGGRIIGIERPDAKLRGTDVTEAERTAIKPDIVMLNNGSFEQLQVAAETLMNDIQAGNPKPRYSAA